MQMTCVQLMRLQSDLVRPRFYALPLIILSELHFGKQNPSRLEQEEALDWYPSNICLTASMQRIGNQISERIP